MREQFVYTQFMLNTTLCYIENSGHYLMLLRNKKKLDLNEGKWIGIGGKLEENETIEECMLREVREETSLLLTSYRYRGVIDFVSDSAPEEIMHLYTATIPDMSSPIECKEGTLKWIPISEVSGLNLWEGDRVFLKLLLEDAPFFHLRLIYHGDSLISSETHYPNL